MFTRIGIIGGTSLNAFIFIILTCIFMISPYFRGLYYNESFYPVILILAPLFLILFFQLWRKKEWQSISTSLLVRLLPVCYMVSFFTAENPKGAVDSILQWIGYGAFFILLFRLSQVRKIKALMPMVFHLTGSLLAIFTLLSYYDVISYRSTVVAGRFAGVFQYPNTFGMVMAVFILFSLMMLAGKEEMKIPEFILYSFSVVLLVTCLIQSFSRSMFLLFPLLWFFGLLLLDRKKQIIYFVHSLFAFGFGLWGYQSMEIGEANGRDFPGLMALIIGSILFVVGAYYTNKFLLKKELHFISKGNRFIIPGVLLLVLLLAVLDLKFEGFVFQQLPEALKGASARR